MPESYVRPVTSAKEPGPAWLPIWRFRLVALLILAVIAFATVRTVQYFQGSTRQDPGLDQPQEPQPLPS